MTYRELCIFLLVLLTFGCSKQDSQNSSEGSTGSDTPDSINRVEEPKTEAGKLIDKDEEKLQSGILARSVPIMIVQSPTKRTFVPSGFYLKAEEEEYGKPATDVVKNADAEEAFLVKILNAFSSGKEEAVWSLAVQGEKETSFGFYNLYSEQLRKVEAPRILHRFDVGGLTYFAVEIPVENVKFIAFPIVHTDGGGLELSFGAMVHPVVQLISQTYTAMLAQPEDFPLTDVGSKSCLLYTFPSPRDRG